MAYTSIASFCSDIADAIRAQTGGSSPIAAEDFPTAIAGISTANVETATAQPTSTSSIKFTGLNGSPKMFCITLDSSSTGSFSNARRIAAIIGYGTTTYGIYASQSSRSAYVYWNNSYYEWTYSGGTLTATCSSTSSGGSFVTSKTYRLVYVY